MAAGYHVVANQIAHQRDPFDIVQLNEVAKAATSGAEVRRRLKIDAQSTDIDYALSCIKNCLFYCRCRVSFITNYQI